MPRLGGITCSALPPPTLVTPPAARNISRPSSLQHHFNFNTIHDSHISPPIPHLPSLLSISRIISSCFRTAIPFKSFRRPSATTTLSSSHIHIHHNASSLKAHDRKPSAAPPPSPRQTRSWRRRRSSPIRFLQRQLLLLRRNLAQETIAQQACSASRSFT